MAAPPARQLPQRGALRGGLVAFTVLGVDDNSSKMPLLLAYSPVAQPQAGRANQNPPKGGRVGARKSGTAAVSGKVSANTSAIASSAAAALAPWKASPPSCTPGLLWGGG